VTHGTVSRPIRITLLAALIAGYIVAVRLGFRPVQLRVWNDFGTVDLVIMGALILPFIVVPRFVRPGCRVTRWAWGVSALMAMDVVFFGLGELGPLGSGHPSLESLLSYFLALAKPVLVPVGLILLSVACIKREQVVLVVTGFLCLVGETLYGTYPTDWWG
jgi:hypothetical protein